uniref:THAP-type domain-containing protein n=1 Tax=Erpetoichthys calabaricus TaxID=27687 RepID=A0A8C4X5K7_ERPCA
MTKSGCSTVLRFHTFTSDVETQFKWIIAVRRVSFTVSPHAQVCSSYFKKEDFQKSGSETGWRLLKKGAVPALSDCRAST